MKIGDEIYVHGYVDEIRKDTVIIRNEGGYFGTVPAEVMVGELPPAQPEIIRCKDCKHRYEDECPMHHVEWVEYDDDGYIDSDDVIYDYTEDDGYCFKAERRTEWRSL